MKIQCQTLFDITATGITGHYRSSRVPFTDTAGQQIVDELTWNRARNQQRNWETLTQLISLRTQVYTTTPVLTDNRWSFEFTIESDSIFDGDPTELLKSDCQGVPMLLGGEDLMLSTQGPMQNIWFTIMSINN